MSKSQLSRDGRDLSITSRCWSLPRTNPFSISITFRCDATTHNGVVVTSGQTICHQYWLCFLLYDCSIEKKKKTNNQKCSTCCLCVCVCLSRHSIACAPGPCNPSWTSFFLFYFYIIWWRHRLPPPLPWYSPLFFCYVHQKKMNKKMNNRRKTDQ